MSLTFTDTTTDVVDVGSPAAFDTMAVGTILTWVNPTTLANNHSYVRKRVSSTQNLSFQGSDASGNLGFFIAQSADLQVITNDTPLSTGAWHFAGVHWDVGGATGDQAIFTGTLSALATANSLGTQTEGTAPQGNDSSASMGLGNTAPGNNGSSCAADIAWVGIWDIRLTLAQIQAQQFHPHVNANCIGMWHLGFAGDTGTVADLSGNGNNGTPTGTTVADHVPLGPQFGFDNYSPYVVAAATGPNMLTLLGVG